MSSLKKQDVTLIIDKKKKNAEIVEEIFVQNVEINSYHLPVFDTICSIPGRQLF